ncbi:MAG: hypothetical protein HY077_16055 [Elusimicrobia bacterium]|nr:hypothetical protein [Elusimicrobiota bacterium]
MDEAIKTLTYRFRLKDGREKEFKVVLERPSMRQGLPARAEYPAWTKLEFQQCPNCPLKPADSPRCPAAVSLVDVVEFFKELPSYEVVEVRITSDEREYSGTKSLQAVLNALMGVHMATSGCPILDRLRPMAFTHLPFSTMDETLYRVIAMYLVSQFLRHRRGKAADWDLKKLVGIYEAIYAVNVAFVKRLQSINPQDASLNAVASLDCFGAFTRFSLSKDSLEQMEALFAAYLAD